MSNRRSRSRMTEEQINELVLKLQAVLPETRTGSSNYVMSAAKVLQETCSYIRSLHREVDDLSERLSDLLATADISDAQATVIRSLLM